MEVKGTDIFYHNITDRPIDQIIQEKEKIYKHIYATFISSILTHSGDVLTFTKNKIGNYSLFINSENHCGCFCDINNGWGYKLIKYVGKNEFQILTTDINGFPADFDMSIQIVTVSN